MNTVSAPSILWDKENHLFVPSQSLVKMSWVCTAYSLCFENVFFVDLLQDVTESDLSLFILTYFSSSNTWSWLQRQTYSSRWGSFCPHWPVLRQTKAQGQLVQRWCWCTRRWSHSYKDHTHHTCSWEGQSQAFRFWQILRGSGEQYRLPERFLPS